MAEAEAEGAHWQLPAAVAIWLWFLWSSKMAVKFEEAELEDEHSDSFSAHDSPELNVSCKIKNADTHMNAQKQLNL